MGDTPRNGGASTLGLLAVWAAAAIGSLLLVALWVSFVGIAESVALGGGSAPALALETAAIPAIELVALLALAWRWRRRSGSARTAIRRGALVVWGMVALNYLLMLSWHIY